MFRAPTGAMGARAARAHAVARVLLRCVRACLDTAVPCASDACGGSEEDLCRCATKSRPQSSAKASAFNLTPARADRGRPCSPLVHNSFSSWLLARTECVSTRGRDLLY